MKFMKSRIVVAICAVFMLAPGVVPEKASKESKSDTESKSVFTVKSSERSELRDAQVRPLAIVRRFKTQCRRAFV